MSDLKNIVIIGASVAGGNLVNELAPHLPGTHRILLIDALGFSFWPIASLRASVVPGWEKRVTIPLTREAIFDKGSKHQLISPNKVVELKENSIILEQPFEGSTEISFVKAIIATGAQQPAPMRPTPGSTEQEYIDSLVKYQQDFGRAKKVLIVGGGAVGLEIAGELREQHPQLGITIVHSLPSVLNPTSKPVDMNAGPFNYSNPPTPAKLSKAIESQLKELNIELITDDRVATPSQPSDDVSQWNGSTGLQESMKKVKLESGKELEADYVFMGVGNKPNTSLVEEVDNQAIDAGLIAVDKYLKVVSKNNDSILTKNYYALGDCCAAPGWKTAQGCQAEAAGAAANILAEISGKPIKPYSRPKPYAMVIPLGTKAGAGTLDLPIFGTVFLPLFMMKKVKSQGLFVSDLFYGRFKGSNKPTVPAITA